MDFSIRALPIPKWKRAVDFFVGFLGLVATLPVQVAVAALVFVTSGWPIFFFQERIGQGGKPFIVWKFRSLRFCSGEISRVNERTDSRLTPMGGFLRAWKLDELPQFWNVIRGEMSLVGPRPVEPKRAEYFCHLLPEYRQRFAIRPGLTGFAQVHNKSHEVETFREALAEDLYYIEHEEDWWLVDPLVIFVTILRFSKPHES